MKHSWIIAVIILLLAAMAIADEAGAVELVDAVVPPLLQLVGTLLGIPLLVGAGMLWGRAEPARTVENMVGAVQRGRLGLKNLCPEGLGILDNWLTIEQSDETKKVVKGLKRKRSVESVTDEARQT